MASPLIQEVNDAISVPVLNRQGETVETLTIDPIEFGGKISPRLMHEAVLQFLANQRAGTHSTLRRGEVAGSTKKLFRQKGTGNARVGNKRTNKRRGGGTSKGPKPPRLRIPHAQKGRPLGHAHGHPLEVPRRRGDRRR